MEDGEGRRIDFRNTIIVLTSNVGADVIACICSDLQLMPEPKVLSGVLRDPLLVVFPAALLGRVWVVPYYPLTDVTLVNIVRLQLSRVQKRLAENQNIVCTFDDVVIDQIVGRCTELVSRGRMVDAILTNTLLPEISERLLTGSLRDHNIIANYTLRQTTTNLLINLMRKLCRVERADKH